MVVCVVVCIEWEHGRFMMAAGNPEADVLEKGESGLKMTHELGSRRRK